MHPSLAIRVRDLTASLHFYRDQMGYAVTEEHLVQLPNDQLLLLAEEGANLPPEVEVVQPGDPIYLWAGGLVALHSRLAGFDRPGMILKQNPVWITLSIPDPDGVRLDFMEERSLTDAEILDLYENCPSRLQEMLHGLSETDFDLTRAEGKWSIRQIVHHLVDSAHVVSVGVKFALAEPGRPYTPNLLAGDAFAAGLDYAHRPIQAELALYAAVHAQIAGLCRHLPEALDRHILVGGQPRYVRLTIQQTAGHLHHHLDQIAETRRVHNK